MRLAGMIGLLFLSWACILGAVAWAPLCTATSPQGPTIGHVIKLYGC